MPSRDRDRPLTHPIALAAIVVLIVNDHVLKSAWPGVVTGKLSDIAGMIVFPLFLSALLRGRALGWCIAATAIAFTLVKTWDPATHVYEALLGDIVQDPTDLLAVPFTLVGLALRSKTAG